MVNLRLLKNRIREASALASICFLCISMLLPTTVISTRVSAQAPAKKEPAPEVPLVADAYRVTNFISDWPGLGFTVDPLLINPWGISLTASSPFWVANNGTSTSTLYRGDVGGSPLIKQASMPFITVPGNLPTGTVANGTTDFVITSGSASGPARFLFASITGNIVGWNPAVPAAGSTTGIIAASQAGHVYTGLALASNGGNNFLYAADFANGRIDVFNSTFVLQPAASFPFVDPTIPTVVGNTFHPYNIQLLGSSLYVEYAKVGLDGRAVPGVGNGFVRRFNTAGVRDLTFGINSGPLNAPWGIAIAPASFGVHSNALLVGNFGAGNPSIHAFNATTGAFIAPLTDDSGTGIVIDGLWGLTFGNGGNGGDTNTLYFAAGPSLEQHGIFGGIKAVSPGAVTTLQFSTTAYEIAEGDGGISVTVTRNGSVSGTASVNYTTLDTSAATGFATQKSDYEIAAGTVNFLPGETSKTFRILLVDDVYVEGPEAVTLVLSNGAGSTTGSGQNVALGSPHTAVLTITDNDAVGPTNQPLENAQFFVRQQYLDFLNREPDPGGFAFWTNEITSCGADAVCITNRRVRVSAAFFFEQEFQQSGYFIYRVRKSAFGTHPLYGEYVVDRSLIGVGSDAEKTSFVNQFVNQPEFVGRYAALTNTQYVDALLTNVGISPTTMRLYSTTLSGAQEVPPNASTATGTSTIQLNAAETSGTVTLSFSGLSSAQTDAHIHGPADPGVNAPPVFPLPLGQISNFAITLTPAQLADLKAGKYYANVHSSNFPGGEIRGQYPSSTAFRDSLIAGLNAATETRASVLRKVAENEEVMRKEVNTAFVLAEYFGYLRRDPDTAGFNFWLNIVGTQPPEAFFKGMVCAFLTSIEYQQRFSSVVSRNDSQCATLTAAPNNDQ